MRLWLPGVVLLVLACAGQTSSPLVTSAGEVERTENGRLPGTAEGVCARLDECGCNPAPTFRTCVVQQRVAFQVVDGIVDLQEKIVDKGLEAVPAEEAELVRGVTRAGTDIVRKGMRWSMGAAANLECEPLCAEIAKSRSEGPP